MSSRWSWQGPPPSLWGAIRSDVPWIKFLPVGSSDSHYSGSPDKMQSENPDIPALSRPDPESSSEKRGRSAADMLWDACVPPGPPLSPRHRMVRRSNPPIHTRRNPALNKETCSAAGSASCPDYFGTLPSCAGLAVPYGPLSAEWVSKIFSGGCPE